MSMRYSSPATAEALQSLHCIMRSKRMKAIQTANAQRHNESLGAPGPGLPGEISPPPFHDVPPLGSKTGATTSEYPEFTGPANDTSVKIKEESESESNVGLIDNYYVEEQNIRVMRNALVDRSKDSSTNILLGHLKTDKPREQLKQPRPVTQSLSVSRAPYRRKYKKRAGQFIQSGLDILQTNDRSRLHENNPLAELSGLKGHVIAARLGCSDRVAYALRAIATDGIGLKSGRKQMYLSTLTQALSDNSSQDYQSKHHNASTPGARSRQVSSPSTALTSKPSTETKLQTTMAAQLPLPALVPASNPPPNIYGPIVEEHKEEIRFLRYLLSAKGVDQVTINEIRARGIMGQELVEATQLILGEVDRDLIEQTRGPPAARRH